MNASEPPEPDPSKLSSGGIGPLDPAELLARALNTVQPSADAAAWNPPPPEDLARLLPQYGIEGLLGRGGMGAVYRGVQPALDRPVAIKLLPPELAADEQFLERFRREARTLAKLQHSGIVSVYDFGQTSEGHPYFVMEFVDGTDLQRILRGPGLSPSQALELISQVCDALHYAHSKGVIHRDIKPGNILVTAEGRAKLADFGLARPIKEGKEKLTGPTIVMGTPDYMAPEQRSGHADQRVDIYALGVMLYEMLTGKCPSGVFVPPSHRVQVDIRLDEVVLKAVQQEPGRRYQQVSEMKTDVDIIRTTPAEGAPKEKKQPQVAPRNRTAAIATLAAVLAVGGFLLWKPWEIHASQRKLAQSVLSKGGFVELWRGLESFPVLQAEDLPPGNIRLRHVDEVKGRFDDEDAELIASCHELESLRLHGCNLTALSFEKMPELKNFEVGNSKFTASGLRSLAGKQELSKVFISKMPQLGGEIVNVLAECPMMQNITLDSVGLRDGDLQPLVRLKGLKFLHVGGNAFSDASLAVLTGNQSLQTLSFRDMDFSSASLAFLTQMKALSKVHFEKCKVPSAVCANLAKMPALSELDLIEIDINDETLRALSGFTGLRDLNLRGTPATDASIATLITLAGLQTLDISNTTITAEGAAAIREALPTCQVRR